MPKNNGRHSTHRARIELNSDSIFTNVERRILSRITFELSLVNCHRSNGQCTSLNITRSDHFSVWQIQIATIMSNKVERTSVTRMDNWWARSLNEMCCLHEADYEFEMWTTLRLRLNRKEVWNFYRSTATAVYLQITIYFVTAISLHQTALVICLKFVCLSDRWFFLSLSLYLLISTSEKCRLSSNS